MFLVTRQDLSPQVQTVQTLHALTELAMQFRSEFEYWTTEGCGTNKIVTVEVKNELELYNLQHLLKNKKNIKCISEFREPDMLDELTAIAVYPTDEQLKCLSHLTLLGKKSKTPEFIEQLRLSERHKRQLSASMEACMQAEGLSVLAHGQSVYRATESLLAAMENGSSTIIFNNEEHKIPQLLLENKELFFTSIKKLGGQFWLRKYCVLHDIGKPATNVENNNDNNSFPNHEQESEKILKNLVELLPDISAEKSNPKDFFSVVSLVGHDMFIHRLRSSHEDEIIDFVEINDSFIFLINTLVGFAEIIANTKPLFGGIKSDSYKIKHKRFSKVLEKILLIYEQQKYETKTRNT